VDWVYRTDVGEGEQHSRESYHFRVQAFAQYSFGSWNSQAESCRTVCHRCLIRLGGGGTRKTALRAAKFNIVQSLDSLHVSVKMYCNCLFDIDFVLKCWLH
jgi:hypothetical protein